MVEIIKQYFEIETKEEAIEVIILALSIVGGFGFLFMFMWFLYFIGALNGQY